MSFVVIQERNSRNDWMLAWRRNFERKFVKWSYSETFNDLLLAWLFELV